MSNPLSYVLHPNTDYYVYVRSNKFAISRTSAGKNSGHDDWTMHGISFRMKVEGYAARNPSEDASLASLYVRGGGLLAVPSIVAGQTETDLTYRMPNNASGIMYFRTRDKNAKVYTIGADKTVGTQAITEHLVGVDRGKTIVFSLQVTAEDGEATHRYNIKLYAHVATPTAVDGALAAAAFTIDEWGYMAGQTTGMKGIYEQSGIGVFVSAPNGSEGSSRPHEQVTFRTPNMPANARPIRLGAVVSADMTGYGGFYANTISACFWKSYTMPSPESLNGLFMRLAHSTGTTNLAFKDAEGFRNSRSSKCWKWNRPAAIANDWDFGEVVTVSMHWDGTNTDPNATGKPVISSSTVSTESPVNKVTLLQYGVSAYVHNGDINDPDGVYSAIAYTEVREYDDDPLVRTYTNLDHTFTYECVRVNGNSETVVGTETTYVPVLADRGKHIKLKATFKDDEGNVETRDGDPILVKSGTLTLDPNLEATHPGDVVIWQATLTPVNVPTRGIGCFFGITTLCASALSTGTFTRNSKEYRLAAILNTSNSMEFWTHGPDNPGLGDMSLIVDGRRFPIATTDISTGTTQLSGWIHIHRWATANGLSLTIGTPVDIALVRPSLMATIEEIAPFERANGETLPRFDLKLSERSVMANADLRNHTFTLTNGTITRSKRIDKKVRGVKPNRRISSKHWRFEIRPTDRTKAVSVEMPLKGCNVQGALCTPGGLGIEKAQTIDFGIPGNTTLRVSIADVSTTEGSTLKFPVTISRTTVHDIILHFSTTDGTGEKSATKGTDYNDHVQGVVWYDAGRTSGVIAIPTIDDDINDDGETMTLTLTKAYLRPPNGRWSRRDDILAEGEGRTATGTINNSDPIPKAWLARFGRTVAEQVLDAVGARLRTAPRAGVEATLAGEALPRWNADGTGAGGTNDSGTEDAAARAKAAREAEAQEAEAKERLTSFSDWLRAAGRTGGTARTGPASARAR